LTLLQVDDALARWREARLPAMPPAGWVATIRDALGMTAAAFARRLNMTPAGVRKLEKAEADQVITLASLHKLAEALDCRLEYALVPRRPLQDMLQERARQLAAAELAPVSHSMVLEDQAVQRSMRQQIEVLAEEILTRRPRHDLW